MYRFYIITDNNEGVLVKLCNLFSARGINIQMLHAQPFSDNQNLSSIEMTAELNDDKIVNMKEKILQIVPIREVTISKITEIII